MTKIGFTVEGMHKKLIEELEKQIKEKAHKKALEATEGLKGWKAKRVYKKVSRKACIDIADEYLKAFDNEELIKKASEEALEKSTKEVMVITKQKEREEREEFPFAKIYDAQGNIVKGELNEKVNELFRQRYTLTEQIKKEKSEEKNDLIKKRQKIMKEAIKLQENNPGFRIVRTR